MWVFGGASKVGQEDMFSLSYWRQEYISSIPPATEHCSVYNWIAVANATCSLLAKIITEDQEFNKKTLRNPRRAHTSPQRILSHFSQRLWIAQVSLYFWNKWIHWLLDWLTDWLTHSLLHFTNIYVKHSPHARQPNVLGIWREIRCGLCSSRSPSPVGYR